MIDPFLKYDTSPTVSSDWDLFYSTENGTGSTLSYESDEFSTSGMTVSHTRCDKSTKIDEDERRKQIRWNNSIEFSQFLYDHYPIYHPLPRIISPIRKWGTANHQRPVPMLC
jgi:hypothetical protein